MAQHVPGLMTCRQSSSPSTSSRIHVAGGKTNDGLQFMRSSPLILGNTGIAVKNPEGILNYYPVFDSLNVVQREPLMRQPL